jgi:hypothetical protein
MFERVKVDNTQELGTVAVEVTLDDGRQLTGRFAIPRSRSLFEVLNGPQCFIDFEPYGGERQYLAKAMLRTLKLLNPPQQAGLGGRLKDLDGFDPYRVLGVSEQATFDDVRHAFHTLSKAYHPDRYATAELPGEVRDYLSAMSRRINAAYAALEAPELAKRNATAGRTEPVYSRAAR